MSLLEFAEKQLGLSLSYYQKELLTQMEKHQGNVYFHKPRTHSMRFIDEIYKKYSEVFVV